MHDVENELRQVLRERSGDVGPFDPRMPGRVVRRSRVRRAVTAGAAGIGAAAVLVGLVVGVRAISLPDGRGPANESPSPTRVVSAPSTFVGFTDDAVVLVDSKTGDVVSTIAGRDVVGPRSRGADFFTPSLALAPDGSAVYFTATESEGPGRRLLVA